MTTKNRGKEMSLPKEKINRIQEMIKELRDVETYIENEIRVHQVRLDEHRKRRAILQDLLGIETEK